MSDIFNKVTNDQDPISKLLSKIPGFKGYLEGANRRSSDKLLREKLADEFEAQYQRISGLQRELISQGGIEYIDDVERAAIKLRQFIDRVRNAAYGYAGLLDAVKVNNDELANVYSFDLALLEMSGGIASAIDNVEASIGSEGLPASIKHLTTLAQESVDTFNKRSEVLKGLAN